MSKSYELIRKNMKTKTYNVYKFDELSDEQKKKVLNNYSDINVDDSYWYEHYKDDCDIEIVSFDIDRGNFCEIEFETVAIATARHIVKNHGEQCDTYKTSFEFIKDYLPLEKIYDEDIAGDELENEHKITELCENYKQALSEDVLSLLRKEYEYQTSDDAIIKTIKANNYDFTEDGKID